PGPIAMRIAKLEGVTDTSAAVCRCSSVHRLPENLLAACPPLTHQPPSNAGESSDPLQPARRAPESEVRASPQPQAADHTARDDEGAAANSAADHDRAAAEELGRFGYVQQLKRSMGGFSSFAISFSLISITTGIFADFGHGLQQFGPALIWSWCL